MLYHYRHCRQSFTLFTLCLLLITGLTTSITQDAPTMLALKNTLTNAGSLGWTDPDPCNWKNVGCNQNRVNRIQLGRMGLKGTLPPDLNKLDQLEQLELQWNSISGPLPTLSGLTSLQVLMISSNQFDSIPPDFFHGMSSLQSVEMDNNPLSPWEFPESLRNASSLQKFSANSVNLTGSIPDFFGSDVFPGLVTLHLAINGLEGTLPASFGRSDIQSLWLNGQKSSSKLTGGLEVLQNMTSLKEAWLHDNAFTGPLPDFTGLVSLESLSLRDNELTGPVPDSLTGLDSLRFVNLTNNLFQGAVPQFKSEVKVDMVKDSNSFCLSGPGECDSRVEALISVAKSLGYPRRFADNWKGNDPCSNWVGISCSSGNNITAVNFQKMGLSGTISPDLGSLTSVQRLLLSDNNLTGTLPKELASLPNLKEVDVSNNQISGDVPGFKDGIDVKTAGNKDIGKDISVLPPDAAGSSSQVPDGSTGTGNGTGTKSKSSSMVMVIFFSLLASLLVVFLIGLLVYKKKQKLKFTRVQSPNATMVIHPRHSGSDNESVGKITTAATAGSVVGTLSETRTTMAMSELGGGSGDHQIQMVEGGGGGSNSMVISIQVLRNVTDNFSEKNILGQGGFGVVYKGELHDGTKIAVKRMESGVMKSKGDSEFMSEISVLTKVRHRHLVGLLGYCLDGHEKLLVYEYMPQGTLSSHLFNWEGEGLKPLDWTRRLTIALDVARGVEYLHGLAHQSFIHRDLKPSNILLGDDMRAKVADFGLVRLAPEGKGSIETRIAGTFGYLAPEYAVTGRVTTKVDVFSFGVILMELITGRRALDETQPEESMHLVTWFKRMSLNKEQFRKQAIDPTIDQTNEETLASVTTVAEFAGHCCAREPYQRPDMGHAVNLLSSLVELWKPSDQTPEDMYGIDLDMSLPQALQRWQAYEGRSNLESSSSSLLVPSSLDNTQASIPPRPYGSSESYSWLMRGDDRHG